MASSNGGMARNMYQMYYVTLTHWRFTTCIVISVDLMSIV